MSYSNQQQQISLRQQLTERYLMFTNEILPKQALLGHVRWPVTENHCFRRIVMDAVCGGVWQRHISAPAYKNMTIEQLKKALHICECIHNGSMDINMLNAQSLAWRKQQQSRQLSLSL